MSWIGDEVRFVATSDSDIYMFAVDVATPYEETFTYYRHQNYINARADTLV